MFNIGLQKTKALIKMATSQLLVGLVFRFQLDYSCRIKSVPPEAKNREEDYFGFRDPGPRQRARESSSTQNVVLGTRLSADTGTVM